VFPGRKRAELAGSDRHAHESQGRKPDRRGHAPHLAVATLAEVELEPPRRDCGAIADRWLARPEARLVRQESRTRGAGRAIGKTHPALERGERRRADLALDLHQVALLDAVRRVGEARQQAAVVGEEEQPLTVEIEPADRPQAWQRKVVRQTGPTGRIGREPGQYPERLIEEDERHGPSRAVEPDPTRGYPCAVHNTRRRGPATADGASGRVAEAP